MTPRARRRRYAREAFLVIFIVRCAISIFSLPLVLKWVQKPLRRPTRFRRYEVPWIQWASYRAGSRHRLQASSIPVALCIYRMLRRRGIESRICLGVRNGREPLTCHAWILLNDNTPVRPIDADDLILMTEFGSQR